MLSVENSSGTSKKSKLKMMKFAHESLLSVEKNLAYFQETSSKSRTIGSTSEPRWAQKLQGMSCRKSVPESEILSFEHNKEIRCSKWRKDQRLG